MLGITLSVLAWLKLALGNGGFVEMGEVRVEMTVHPKCILTDGCGDKGCGGAGALSCSWGVSSLTHRPFLRVTLSPSLQNGTSDASTTFAKSFERFVSLLQMQGKI